MKRLLLLALLLAGCASAPKPETHVAVVGHEAVSFTLPGGFQGNPHQAEFGGNHRHLTVRQARSKTPEDFLKERPSVVSQSDVTVAGEPAVRAVYSNGEQEVHGLLVLHGKRVISFETFMSSRPDEKERAEAEALLDGVASSLQLNAPMPSRVAARPERPQASRRWSLRDYSPYWEMAVLLVLCLPGALGASAGYRTARILEEPLERAVFRSALSPMLLTWTVLGLCLGVWAFLSTVSKPSYGSMPNSVGGVIIGFMLAAGGTAAGGAGGVMAGVGGALGSRVSARATFWLAWLTPFLGVVAYWASRRH